MVIQRIDYRVTRPDQGGDNAVAKGTIECRPSLRRYLDHGVVLPAQFRAPLVNGIAILKLAEPDPQSWCWEIVERCDRGIRRYVLFEASDDPEGVLYADDLVDVDPESFDPVPSPTAAWVAPLDALAETVAGIDADLGSLSPVATSGEYSDLEGAPALGTAAAADVEEFASAAQGGKADLALPAADLDASVAGKVSDPGSATAGALTAKIDEGALPAVRVSNAPSVRLPARQRPTWLSTFQSGHGWTSQSGGVLADDTSDYILGSQSLSLSNGAAERSISVDMTDRHLCVWVKIKTLATGNSLVVYAGDSAFSNFRTWTVRAGAEPSPWFRDGDWALVTLPWDDSTMSGTLDRSAVARLRIRTYTAGSVLINAIGTVPATAGQWPNGCVSITFDDGYDDTIQAARRSMTPRGLIGTLFHIPSATGTTGFLTRAELDELAHEHGWDIQAHGATEYTTMTPDQMRSEWRATKNWFADNGLGRPDHLAYPGGQVNATVATVAREFFASGRTISSRQAETWPPPMPHRVRALSSISDYSGGVSVATVKSRIDKAAADGTHLILVFHRIVDTPANTVDCSWTAFEDVLDYVVSSGVEVRTYADALAA